MSLTTVQRLLTRPRQPKKASVLGTLAQVPEALTRIGNFPISLPTAAFASNPENPRTIHSGIGESLWDEDDIGSGGSGADSSTALSIIKQQDPKLYKQVVQIMKDDPDFGYKGGEHLGRILQSGWLWPSLSGVGVEETGKPEDFIKGLRSGEGAGFLTRWLAPATGSGRGAGAAWRKHHPEIARKMLKAIEQYYRQKEEQGQRWEEGGKTASSQAGGLQYNPRLKKESSMSGTNAPRRLPKLAELDEKGMQKFAQQDQFDAEQAFELGFAKAAQDMGMNKAQYKQFYQVACADMAQQSG